MKVELQREIKVSLSHEQVLSRAKKWAEAEEFVMVTQRESELVFQRGSRWHTLYTTKIEKVPTTVTILIKGDKTLTLDCEFVVKSKLMASTPGDMQNISEHFDILIEYLKPKVEAI